MLVIYKIYFTTPFSMADSIVITVYNAVEVCFLDNPLLVGIFVP